MLQAPTPSPCVICGKEPCEPGFLGCATCFNSKIYLCALCRQRPAEKGYDFCTNCWMGRTNICRMCNKANNDKNSPICPQCYPRVKQCPLCLIEKLEKGWLTCRKCFHAGARLCRTCRFRPTLPATQFCVTCTPAPSVTVPQASIALSKAPSAGVAPPLKRLSLEQFLPIFERFVINSRTIKTKFLFFIGAGCSISSGIPSAGRLVMDWGFGPNVSYIEAITQRYEFTGESFSSLALRFPLPSERAEEFWRLAHNKQPSPGYHNLARLVRLLSPAANLLVTTNFDHMLARALPEALVASDGPSSYYITSWLDHNSPVIVQMHGDYCRRISNTQAEMHAALESPIMRDGESMPKAVASVLRPLFERRPQVLLVLGYSGSDQNVVDFIKHTEFEPESIYWINGNQPTPANSLISDVLREKRAVWVEHVSFDTLMEHMLACATAKLVPPNA